MSEIPTDLLLPKAENQYQKDLNVVLSDIIRKIAEAVNSNVFLPSDGAFYLGDLDTDGSFRITVSGSSLVAQELIAGTWTTGSVIIA